jgi:hypothetical protein
MKKNRGDKITGLHINMEYHKETPFITNKQKCHFFLLFILLFSSAKWENRRVEQVLPRAGVGTSGSGEVAGIGYRRVNIMQKTVYTCM